MNQIIEIPLAELFPHPDNPRKDLGDLTELAASIKESGLLQNLTVIDGRYLDEQEWAEMEAADERLAALTGGTYEPLEYDPHNPIADGYTVIIGHRRCEAARLAGLETVPCAVVEMDYKTQLATMMAENVQRADLTPFEQANGLVKWIDDALRHPGSNTDRGVTYAAVEASRVERGDVIRCEPEVGGAGDIKVIVPGSLFATRPYEAPGY